MDETPLPELCCQQLDVLVHYFSDVHKQAIVEHLRSFHLGSATSNIIFKCVNEALVNIPRVGFFSFFSDGPNVMKSLKRKLADNLSLIDVGECWLHKVHNAFSHALDFFAAEVESAVVDTYYFFKHSSVQSTHLKEQQNILGLPEAFFFLRHISSRWLSLMPALERLLEQLAPLKSVLAAEAPVRSSGSIKERLRKTINNKEFCAKALFMKNAAEIFTKFLTLFQKSEPLIHILYSECVTLVEKVLGRFLRLNVFQNMSGHQLATLDVESSENWKANVVELGADTEAAMVSWSANEKAAFRLGARTFYMKCARYLLKQLPLKNSVLMHLSGLEPSASVSESSRESFRELAKYAPQVILSSDVSSLLDEVTEFCLEPLPATVDGRLDSYWQNVFERKDAENQAKYPLLTKLVKALLSLPHGNADVERGFSQNNRVLHDRSSLSLESINGTRRTPSFAQRYDGDPCKFEIGRDVKAVRNASKRYSERLAQEKQALKQLRTDVEQSTPNDSEADAQNEAVDAERMLKNAELLIERGMKQKNFGDIQSGQALLMKKQERKWQLV